MIIDINEDNIRLLADSGCPRNLWGINHDFYCILQDDEAYYGLYKWLCHRYLLRLLVEMAL